MSDANLAEKITEAVRSAGFENVTVDLVGFRSGSMNATATAEMHGIGGGSRTLAELGFVGATTVSDGDMITLRLPREDHAELWQAERRDMVVEAFRKRGFVHVALELGSAEVTAG